jgi:hypothetical protein
MQPEAARRVTRGWQQVLPPHDCTTPADRLRSLADNIVAHCRCCRIPLLHTITIAAAYYTVNVDSVCCFLHETLKSSLRSWRRTVILGFVALSCGQCHVC